MRRMNPYDPAISEALTLKGITLSMLLDMSPMDRSLELAQATLSGGLSSNKDINSTGVDDEIRAYEAGQGHETLISHITPDFVEDPFKDAISSTYEAVEETTIFDYPDGVSDLVMHAALGF